MRKPLSLHFSLMMAILAVAMGLLSWTFAQADETTSIRLRDGNEVSVRVFPAKGDTLFIWFACDEGLGTREAITAKQLAQKGYEVWLPDMLGSHFLPAAPSSMAQLPTEELSDVIADVIQRTGKNVYLVTASRGTLPTLLGARAWQQSATEAQKPLLKGAILFYPEVYLETPKPGADAQYHPIIGQTRMNIAVFQGERSPGRWWLGQLKQELEKGGSTVHTVLLPGVRGFFYVRQDATPAEQAMAERLPELILNALDQLHAAEARK